jgi:predicted transcriptional regulator
MERDMTFHRGDICWFTDPVYREENSFVLRGKRPAVIVSTDEANETSGTVVIAPLTTKIDKRLYPGQFDIWLDGTQILTFCSPGDFGGTRGMYTPSYWPINCTQFGELNKITISNDGVFRNNLLIKNNITLKNFDLDNKKSIRFSIGVLEDADHRGGINLFGANFGNYKQAIKMIVKTKINDTDKENN